MTEQNKLQKRKPNRLPHYDYSQNGAYFVTICTINMAQVLGEVVGATVLGRPQTDEHYCKLSPIGEKVKNAIEYINENNSEVAIEKYTIMPNHLHLIISIDGSGDRGRSPLQYLVRSLKSYITKEIEKNIWQKSFYERVIRNEKEYAKIWEYIEFNPHNWNVAEFYNE